MTTGEDTHGCDYFASLFLLPQLCNSTVGGSPHRLIEADAFESALEQAGLDPLRLRSTGGGLVLRFVVHKSSITDHNPSNSGHGT